MKTKFQILLPLACVVTVHAGPRSSTSGDYSITTETADAGGTRATSSAYSHDGSVGGVVGISAVAAPEETTKHGYLGQLYEVTGLDLSSNPPAEMEEETTAQLAAWHSLDDASYLALSASTVDWSTDGSFPLTVNATTGLATAAAVYEDTLTIVTATQGEVPNQLTAELDLTVRDIDPDNYGSYAGDGLADGWQFQYFGLDNPLAGPLMNPDADTLKNIQEFAFGTNPNAVTGSIGIDANGTVTNPRGTPVPYLYGITAQTVDFRAIFSRRKDYQDFGLNYTLQFSTLEEGSPWVTSTAIPTLMDGSDAEIDVVYIPYPLIIQTDNGFEKPRFFRVGVSPSSN
jgi:hypothetical protein